MQVSTQQFSSDQAGPVPTVLAEAVALAEQGRLDRTRFDRLVADVALPARYYREVQRGLEAAGVRLIDDDSSDRSGMERVNGSATDDETAAGSRRVTSGWEGSGFDAFLDRAAHRLLTAEEEVDLGRRVQQGRLAAQVVSEHANRSAEELKRFRRLVRDGQRAADDLALYNVRLVVHLAKRQARRLPSSSSLSHEDLVQEGYFGLARAVEKFDPSMGTRFSTYATWWIRQALSRAVANQSRMIRLPVHVQDRLTAANREMRALEAVGRPAGDSDVAAQLGMAARQLRALRRQALPPLSLDVPAAVGAEVSLGDLVPDASGESVESAVMGRELVAAVHRVLGAELTDRERSVLHRRFGMGGWECQTLETIGNDFGLTRERIRQIEGSALKKLKDARCADALRTLRED